MISTAEATDLIDDLFAELAVALGGTAAVYAVDDDLVWRLVKNLDVVRSKVMRRLIDQGSQDTKPNRNGQNPSLDPHPAIEDFLRSLRRAFGVERGGRIGYTGAWFSGLGHMVVVAVFVRTHRGIMSCRVTVGAFRERIAWLR